MSGGPLPSFGKNAGIFAEIHLPQRGKAFLKEAVISLWTRIYGRPPPHPKAGIEIAINYSEGMGCSPVISVVYYYRGSFDYGGKGT